MIAPKHNLTPVATAANQNSTAAPTAMFLNDQFETYLKVVEMKLDGRVQRLVNLRSLHEKLGVKEDYRHWAPRSLTNSRSVEGTHYLPVVDHRQVPHQGGLRTVEFKEFYACFEKAKIIAARSNAENSLDICEWLVRVEDQVRQSQSGPLLPKDFPSALRAYADEYEAHQITKTQLSTETKRADEAEATIEANVLFDRIRATASRRSSTSASPASSV